jgi:C-terminal processing protease CtpA/Prc
MFAFSTGTFAQQNDEPPPEPPTEEGQVQPRDAADDAPSARRERADSSADQPERSTDQPSDREDQPRDDRFSDRGRRQDEPRASDQRRESGLGITFEEGDELVIQDVSPGTPAAQAGFRVRDRILSVNGREVTGPRRFAAFLGGMSGRRVPVVIERNGRQYTVQLTPGDAGEGPWLGVYLMDAEEESRGAQVTHVYPASPAARAGLRPGDVILAVNDQEVQDTPDLITILDGFEPKSKVTLRLERGGQEVEAPVVLAQRRDFAYQTSVDERSGEQGQAYDDEDPFSNIPPHAMQLEHDRRMAEQHQRIETELRKLQEEVRQLREALQRN